jgi:chemotaxis protein CheC
MITLTPSQHDILKEIVNIGVGRAAGGLNQIVSRHIILNVPEVILTHLKSLDEYEDLYPEGPISTVIQAFSGQYYGKAALAFAPEDSDTLVKAITGGSIDNLDLNTLRREAISEIGNITINAVVGSISNLLQSPLDFFPPKYIEDTVPNILEKESNPNKGGILLLIDVQFIISGLQISGYLLIFFEMGDINVLLWLIDRQLQDGEADGL